MARVDFNILTGGLSGKAGSAVFVQTPTGVVVRPRTVPRDPRTSRQAALRSNLARAVAAYRSLTPAQAAQWRAYAQTLYRVDPHTRAARPRSAYAVFIGLAAKFLQVTPSGIIPSAPPPFPFAGDLLTVTAAGGPGKVTFTASASNAPNVRTELLLQPLRFAHQSAPASHYRTQAFAAFAPGSLSAIVSVAPGWCAAAYRFVNAQTGQEAEMQALGAVLVS